MQQFDSKTRMEFNMNLQAAVRLRIEAAKGDNPYFALYEQYRKLASKKGGSISPKGIEMRNKLWLMERVAAETLPKLKPLVTKRDQLALDNEQEIKRNGTSRATAEVAFMISDLNKKIFALMPKKA